MAKAETKNISDKSAHDSLLVSRVNPTLRQQATDILRQAIIEQRFPPGKHLVERELCELLGVSRTSVREALRYLESEYLIEMVPHKGPVIAMLSYDDACHIYEVRAALEGLAGDLFARNASDAQIARLCAVADSLAAAGFNPDTDVILDIKSTFYDVLFEGAQNPICARMTGSLNARAWVLYRLSLVNQGQNSEMVAEIKRITDAAKVRDAEEMRAACIAHVESASRIVLPQLKQTENEAAQ